MSNGNYNGTIRDESLSLSKSLEHFRIILIITKRRKREGREKRRGGGGEKKKTEKDIKTDIYMYTSMHAERQEFKYTIRTTTNAHTMNHGINHGCLSINKSIIMHQ